MRTGIANASTMVEPMSNRFDTVPAVTAQAVNDANGTASPTDAAGSRWHLNRAGILNVYQYGNEVLHFKGGRLLLRGVNGSGKSTAMNMLLPFLLTTREGRIDAAGDQSGILKSWMLNGRDDAQPVGYLWIEFRRGGEFLVCGCGIKANRQADSVNTWWFITTKRPGIDLDLVAGGTALSSEALRSVLDGDEVFSRARRPDYRRAVEQLLFGGASIDQHVRLINKVRSPRVGDRIDLELRDYLVDALPQVSERALIEAAQPLEDLEEHRRSVAETARTLDAVRGLLDVYRSYCLSDLSRRVAEGRERLGVRRDCDRDEQRRRRAAQAAARELARLDAEIEALVADQRRLRREIEALEKSQAYQQGQQLDGLRQLVGNLAKQRETAATRVDAAQRRVNEDARELAGACLTGRADRDALNASLATAAELGGRCGLDRRPPGPVALAERDLAAGSELTEPATVDLVPSDRELVDSISAVGRRRSDAGQVKQALEDERAATRELDQAESARAHAANAADQAAARLAENVRRLAAARSEWYEEIRLWAAPALESFRSAGLDGPQTAAQAERRPNAEGDAAADPEALRSQLHAEAEALVDYWLGATSAVETRLGREREAEREAQALVDELAGKTEPDAPRLDWQRGDDYCLADLVDFAPHLTDAQRAGLEAALQSSGLLSARPGDGAVELEDGQLVAVASDGAATPLSDFLTVTVPPRLQGEVDGDSIRKLLESISCDPSSDAGTLATLGGAFRVGSLRGLHRKDRAEHIGATARRAALERARAEARRRLDEAAGAVQRSVEELAGHQESQRAARRQRASLPSTAAVLRAQAGVDAAATAHSEAQARRGEAEEAVAEADRALSRASDAVHRTATSLSLPRDFQGLAAFERVLTETDTTLRECRSQVQGLSRSIRAWRVACDHWLTSARTLEHERAEFRRAESRHDEEHASLVTIEDSIGAEYAEVVAVRDRCRSELEDSEAREPELRRERDTALESKAEAESAATTAAERREQAEKACEATRASLDEALSTPGYLGALHTGVDHSDGAAGTVRATDPDYAVRPDAVDSTSGVAAAVTSGTVVSRSSGAEGLREMLEVLDRLLAPAGSEEDTARGSAGTAVTEVRADSVRQSLLQRRDSFGAGWDAEALQPDPAKPLFVEVTGPSGRAPLAQSVRAVTQQHQRVAGLLSRKQDEALRQLLQGMIAREIAEKIFGAERLVDLMNRRLGAVATAHHVGVRLRWRRSRELDAATARLVDLLAKRPDLRTEDEGHELREALSSRLDEVRADQPELPYRELIAETLDYKQWHDMAVMLRRGGRETRLSRSTPLSEGEKKLVAYLPLFAAVSASCDALAEQRAAPGDERLGIARFVLLDDAFAKVSEDNHAALFGLLVELDLDFIATSERLWGTHATVPELAVTEVIRDAALSTILLEHYEWDGTTLSHGDER